MGLLLETNKSETPKNLAQKLKSLDKWYKDTSGNKLKSLLKGINKDNVVEVLEEYDKLSSEKSLTDYITGLSKTSTKSTEKKEYLNVIYDALIQRSADLSIDIAPFQKEFKQIIGKTTTINSMNGSYGMGSKTVSAEISKSDATTLDELIRAISTSIQIEEKIQTNLPQGSNTQTPSKLTPKGYQEATIFFLEAKLKDSKKGFKQQQDYDGWSGKLANATRSLVGSKNTTKLVKQDLEAYNKMLKNLKLAHNKDFPSTAMGKSIATKYQELNDAQALYTELEKQQANAQTEEEKAEIEAQLAVLGSVLNEEFAGFNKNLNIYGKEIDLENTGKASKGHFKKEFEKTYGVKYDPEKIEAYAQFEDKLIMAEMIAGVESAFNKEFESFLNDEPLEIGYTNTIPTKKATYEPSYKKAELKLALYLGNGDLVKGKAELYKAIQKANLPKGANALERYEVLKDIAKHQSKNLNAVVMEATEGKGIEGYQKESDDYYYAAYGTKNDIARRVKEYNHAQMVGSGVVKMSGNIALIIASGFIPGGQGASATMATQLLKGVARGFATGFGSTFITESTDVMTSKGRTLPKELGNITKASMHSGAVLGAFGLTGGLSKLAFAPIKVTQSGAELSSLGLKTTKTASKLADASATVGTSVGMEYVESGNVTMKGQVESMAMIMAFKGMHKYIQEPMMKRITETTTQKALVQAARETLGIPNDVKLTAEVVKKAYNKMARQTHPDKGGSKDAFDIVAQANKILKENINFKGGKAFPKFGREALKNTPQAENTQTPKALPEAKTSQQPKPKEAEVKTKTKNTEIKTETTPKLEVKSKEIEIAKAQAQINNKKVNSDKFKQNLLPGYEDKRITDLNSIETDNIVLVHVTDYLPENGIIQTSKNQTSSTSVRGTVHFAMNHAVWGHVGGTWHDKKYVIIVPFDETTKLNGNKKPLGALSVDTYFEGPLDINSNKTVILSNEDINTNIGNIQKIKSGKEPYKEVNDVISKMGYTSMDGGAVCWGVDLYELNNFTKLTKIEQDKALTNLNAHKKLCKQNNLYSNLHGYSPQGRVENMFTCLSNMKNSSNWITDGVDMKQKFLEILNKYKGFQEQGQGFIVDIKSFSDEMIKAKTPKELLEKMGFDNLEVPGLDDNSFSSINNLVGITKETDVFYDAMHDLFNRKNEITKNTLIEIEEKFNKLSASLYEHELGFTIEEAKSKFDLFINSLNAEEQILIKEFCEEHNKLQGKSFGIINANDLDYINDILPKNKQIQEFFENDWVLEYAKTGLVERNTIQGKEIYNAIKLIKDKKNIVLNKISKLTSSEGDLIFDSRDMQKQAIYITDESVEFFNKLLDKQSDITRQELLMYEKEIKTKSKSDIAIKLLEEQNINQITVKEFIDMVNNSIAERSGVHAQTENAQAQPKSKDYTIEEMENALANIKKKNDTPLLNDECKQTIIYQYNYVSKLKKSNSNNSIKKKDIVSFYKELNSLGIEKIDEYTLDQISSDIFRAGPYLGITPSEFKQNTEFALNILKKEPNIDVLKYVNLTANMDFASSRELRQYKFKFANKMLKYDDFNLKNLTTFFEKHKFSLTENSLKEFDEISNIFSQHRDLSFDDNIYLFYNSNIDIDLVKFKKYVSNTNNSLKDIVKLNTLLKTVDEKYLEQINKDLELSNNVISRKMKILGSLASEAIFKNSFKNSFQNTIFENKKLFDTLCEVKKTNGDCRFNDMDIAKFLVYPQKVNENCIDKVLNWQNSKGELLSMEELIVASNCYDICHKKNNINELSMSGKRALLKTCVNHNATLFECNLENHFPVLPKNADEYCELLPKLVKSLGIETKELSPKEIANFENNFDNLSKTLPKTNLDKLNNIDLEISHSDFIKEFNNVTSALSESEKLKVMDYFGFNLTANNELGGYPINLNNGHKLAEIDNPKAKNIIEQFRPFVQKYSESNSIKLSEEFKGLEKELNLLAKDLPEFYSLIGKKTSDGVKLDIQTLKSLKGVIENPSYAKLSSSDKKVLKLATLLQNMNKVEGVPTESAFDAFYIAQKFNITDRESQKLYKLVKQQNFVEQVSKSDTPDEIAGFIAFELKNNNNFEMAKILSESNAINSYGKSIINKITENIENKINTIKANDFIMPQTKTQDIMKNCSIQEVKGYSVKVANANYIDDFYAYIHTPEAAFAGQNTARSMKLNTLSTFKTIDSDNIICTSLVGGGKYGTAGEHGLVFNIEPQNVYVGKGEDICSPARINTQDLTEYYMFESEQEGPRGSYYKERIHVASELKKVLNISDNEYIDRMAKINNCENLNEIKQIDPELANAYTELFKEEGTLLNSENWSEYLISNPHAQAIYTKDIDNIPEEYLKMAQENDMPILMFGE